MAEEFGLISSSRSWVFRLKELKQELSATSTEPLVLSAALEDLLSSLNGRANLRALAKNGIANGAEMRFPGVDEPDSDKLGTRNHKRYWLLRDMVTKCCVCSCLI